MCCHCGGLTPKTSTPTPLTTTGRAINGMGKVELSSIREREEQRSVGAAMDCRVGVVTSSREGVLERSERLNRKVLECTRAVYMGSNRNVLEQSRGSVSACSKLKCGKADQDCRARCSNLRNVSLAAWI